VEFKFTEVEFTFSGDHYILHCTHETERGRSLEFCQAILPELENVQNIAHS
jgi:hypothetical protein